MKIGLVAGELSGDILGGALVTALRARYPQASFYGVTGPRMQAAGCESLDSIEALSIMGLAEVLPALPRLFRLRARLIERFLQDRPDVVIGIDAPDFNLGLERRLREQGLKTVHVVSPSVWAWRRGRIKGIVRAVDLLLCLLPFEPGFYAGHPLRAEFIGHPLADELDDRIRPEASRAQLGLPAGSLVALLPGSRGGEMKRLAEPFARAAALLHARHPGLRSITPLAKPSLRPLLQAAIAAHAPAVPWTLLEGQSRLAMQAADVVLLASGTATLECLLLGRPMVVAYKVAALTGWLMLDLGLLKTRHVSLPNILSGDTPVVPEILQRHLTPERVAQQIEILLGDAQARERQQNSFNAIRKQLKRDAAQRSAEAIAQLLSK